MVKIGLDSEKFMKLIRARAEFSHMAYPHMTEAEVDKLIERITSDPAFDEMVAECVLIEDEPEDLSVDPFSF